MCRRGCSLKKFSRFFSIFGNIFLVFKGRILGNTEFQKTVRYVTERPNTLRPSRRDVKNHVWKYLQNIVIGLYAVCGYLLDNQDRTLSLGSGQIFYETKCQCAAGKTYATKCAAGQIF
jgi:hypothetical protein